MYWMLFPGTTPPTISSRGWPLRNTLVAAIPIRGLGSGARRVHAFVAGSYTVVMSRHSIASVWALYRRPPMTYSLQPSTLEAAPGRDSASGLFGVHRFVAGS